MKEIAIDCAGKEPGTSKTSMWTKKPRIESQRLFQGNSEVVIVHQNEEYNLRITRKGKLILTK
jgi:hemin uptake protein HemP